MLQFDQKAVILIEKYLLNEVIVFGKLEKVYNVQITIEHIDSFVELKVFFATSHVTQ